MKPFPSTRACLAGALLLQACAAPAPQALKVAPSLQVRHAANETAEAYYQLGRQHQAQGNLDMALTGYTYAIARDPGHLAARSGAAAIHAQQGRLDQARAMLLAVAAAAPEQAQGHNNLGYLDYLRGDYRAAAQSMRRALALEPGNERARNNLRLVEAALASASPLPAAPAAAPAPALAVAPAAPELRRPPQAELLQVVPNVYELKMPARPAVALAAAPRGAPAAGSVEVANADGASGLARRVGALLGRHGMQVARLSNEKPFGQRITRIEYRAGHAQQAEAVRALVGGQLLAVRGPGGADVRVVMGGDWRRALALREPDAAGLTLAAR